jgi:hypothetical protein
MIINLFFFTSNVKTICKYGHVAIYLKEVGHLIGILCFNAIEKNKKYDSWLCNNNEIFMDAIRNNIYIYHYELNCSDDEYNIVLSNIKNDTIKCDYKYCIESENPNKNYGNCWCYLKKIELPIVKDASYDDLNFVSRSKCITTIAKKSQILSKSVFDNFLFLKTVTDIENILSCDEIYFVYFRFELKKKKQTSIFRYGLNGIHFKKNDEEIFTHVYSLCPEVVGNKCFIGNTSDIFNDAKVNKKYKIFNKKIDIDNKKKHILEQLIYRGQFEGLNIKFQNFSRNQILKLLNDDDYSKYFDSREPRTA